MRGKILAYPYSTSLTTPFNINDADLFPFKLAFAEENTGRSIMCSQEGLGIVTYQSDLFNNWLNAESISTANARSNVSTAGGSFSMDAIIMSQKIFNLYNNIIAGGSTVDDWEEAVWGMQKNNRPEIPQYEGGLSQEIVFEEVVSTANVS